MATTTTTQGARGGEGVPHYTDMEQQHQQQQQHDEEQEQLNYDEDDDIEEEEIQFHDVYDPDAHYGHQSVDGGDEQEVQSLVSPIGSLAGRRLTFDDDLEDDDYYYDDPDAGCCKGFRCLTISMILVLTAATLAILLPIESPRVDAFRRWRRHHQLPVEFDCPSHVEQAENIIEDSFAKDYIQVSEQIPDNVTEYLQHFRTENFDNWGHSYEYVKNHSRPFKAKYFPPNLKNGDVIFESACGVGLNLYMTLEILQEFGIDHLIVYGNEYLKVSADKANVLLEEAPAADAERGIICPADSTKLDFVPSNSFDLVYTGYISPILDPLHFEIGAHENYDYYTEICLDDKLWQSIMLRDMAQKIQNDWYGLWVSEMVRIAKPGVPVIVEQVSQPFCSAFYDWGGVSQDWWTTAIDTYNWDIDPDSIEFMNATIFRNRYHVFMRKNGKKATIPGE